MKKMPRMDHFLRKFEYEQWLLVVTCSRLEHHDHVTLVEDVARGVDLNQINCKCQLGPFIDKTSQDNLLIPPTSHGSEKVLYYSLKFQVNGLLTYIHIYLVHTFKPTFTPTCIHSNLPTQLPTYIQTYLQTYLPTYIQTYL